MVKANKKLESAVTAKDEKQRKIYTFFQNQADVEGHAQSKLLTGVGSSQLHHHTSLPVHQDHTVSKHGHLASGSTSTFSVMESVNSESNTKRSLATKHGATSSRDLDCDAEQMCVPKSQTVTPVKSRSDDIDTNQNSPDVIAIPDTPESELTKGKPRKMFKSNRSFLRPDTLLGVRPEVKQGPTKIIKKSKSSIQPNVSLVSVQFNAKKGSCIDCTGQVECIENLSAVEDNGQKCSLDVEEIGRKTGEEVTPTKCYVSDKIHTKRLAKVESSPTAKRVLNLEKKESSTGCSRSDVDNVGKSQVKRVLSLMGEHLDSQVELYSTRQREYQLGITTTKKNKSSADFEENDELLSEILNEIVLKPNVPAKKPICRDTSKAQVKIPLRKVSAVETKGRTGSQQKCLDMDPLTVDELELFKTLDLCFDKSFDSEMADSSYVSSPSVILGNPQCCCISVLNGQRCMEKYCRNKKTNAHTTKMVLETESVNSLEMPCSAQQENRSSCTSQKVVTNSLNAPGTEIKRDISQFQQGAASSVSEDEITSFYASDIEIDFSQSSSTSGKNKFSKTAHCSAISDRKRHVRLTNSPDAPPSPLRPEVGDKPDGLSLSINNEFLCKEFDSFTPFESDETFSKTKSIRPADRFGRYQVARVEHAGPNLILELQSDVKGEEKKCVLHGFWADSHVTAGDTVHILAEFDEERCDVSDEAGLIIVHPDLLLSGTSVVSSVHCMRRSVLSEKFKGCDDKNVHMVLGSIIHSVFQQVLKNNVSSEGDIMKQTTTVIQLSKYLHEMYSVNVSEAVILEEVKKYIPPLMKWLRMHTALNSESSANSVNNVQVCKIQDIEENIWSPRYGIKGKIDLTVDVKIQREKSRIERKVIPLELKTGKTTYSIEHQGQVTLYSMMSSDRRDDPEEGLLLYLKDPDMKLIPVKQDSKRGLIQLRNEIAYYLSQQVVTLSRDDHVTYQCGRLPPPINSSRTCAKCPQLFNCAAYQRTVEQLDLPEQHAMTNLVRSSLSQLTAGHLQYFTHWCLCLDLETRDGQQTRVKDIWCKSSVQREAEGDCLSGMVISETEVGKITESHLFSEGSSCLITFRRANRYNSCSLTPVNTVGISTNDSVAVSTDDGRLLVLSTGIVRGISEHTVQVVVDRDNFHLDENLSAQVFRLDRCDNFNTLGYLYTNLSKLMAHHQHRTRLRELIIDKKKPEFKLTISKGMIEKVKSVFKLLNKPQKTVILKVLMSRDYVLVKGYPGTGKTSTIVALVRILVLLGQSVVVTSYTHSAVDNVLLKLKQHNIPFLRLGRLGRIHKAIHPFAVENLTAGITSVEQLREFYSSQRVVATSCLGSTHPVFSERRFDVCVVDEASQVLQPACLGPLFASDRFVLVGDPQQLPPVVVSRDARELGMSESLFVRLDDTGATFDLNLQYRMNKTIMQLTNELVYDGALQCGSTDIAHKVVEFPQIEQLKNQAVWVQTALAPSLEKSAVFLDTTQVSAPETNDRKGQIRNETEATIVICLLRALIMIGKKAEDIGIISPYRSQVKFLQQRVLRDGLPTVEVNTVDQYQGRDKDVIIISFVRSQASDCSKRAGELLKDVRRLNVSITRARHKLILIGDLGTLRQYNPLEKLINMMTANQQIFPLPEGAVEHVDL